MKSKPTAITAGPTPSALYSVSAATVSSRSKRRRVARTATTLWPSAAAAVACVSSTSASAMLNSYVGARQRSAAACRVAPHDATWQELQVCNHTLATVAVAGYRGLHASHLIKRDMLRCKMPEAQHGVVAVCTSMYYVQPSGEAWHRCRCVGGLEWRPVPGSSWAPKWPPKDRRPDKPRHLGVPDLHSRCLN